MAAGPLRRIAYSFAAFMAGNVVFFFFLPVFTLAATLRWGQRFYPAFVAVLEFYPIYFAVSLAGWILLGILFAVAAPARLLHKLGVLFALSAGGALGSLSLLCIFLLYGLRHGSFIDLVKAWPFFLFSITVGAPAMVVYTSLLRRFDRLHLSPESR